MPRRNLFVRCCLRVSMPSLVAPIEYEGERPPVTFTLRDLTTYQFPGFMVPGECFPFVVSALWISLFR